MNERTNFIISYLADLSGINGKLKELERLNSVIAKEFGSEFSKAVKVIGDGIENISRKTVRLKDGKLATEETRSLSTAVKTADGRMRTLVETTKRVNGAIKSSTTAFRDGSASSKTFGQNLSNLIKRAALTIPTWFLLRNSIRSVFVAIRDGFKSFVEFDNILQKAKRNLQGSAEQIDSDFKSIKAGIEDLAATTGESATDIADAFQRFATLGFDAETSLAGATAVTKLAILQFDELDNIANGLARTFKVLSKSFGENTKDGDNLIETVALLDELWKENAFDANELIAGLERFAPTASRLNISLKESAQLLATLQSAAVVSTRGGRLLSRSFDELSTNISKTGKVLGLEVNPAAEGTVAVFLKVIRALEQLREEEGFSPRLQSALKELFGGRIGREAAASITAIREQLEKNIQLEGDVEAFNKSLADVTGTVSRQVKIFGELRTAMNRSFIVGLVGGDDFADSLETINRFLKNNIESAKIFGQVLREDAQFISNLVTGISTLGIGTGFKAIQGAIERVSDESSALSEDINKALFGQLDGSQVQDVIEQALDAFEAGNPRITDPILSALFDVRDKIERGDPIDVKFAVSDGPGNILNELNNLSDNAGTNQEQLNNLLKDEDSISKSILANELELLRARGASESQVLRAESALLKQLNIKEDVLDTLKRELDLEKAIKDERRLQNNVSSESLKLFNIAKQEGVAVARTISDVLSGDIDLDNFLRRGGQAVDVFKREFDSLFQGQQAERFFSGRSVDGVRGGSLINTKENFGTNTPAFNQNAALAQQRALSRLAPGSTQSVSQNNTINNTFNVSSSDPQEILKVVNDAFTNPQSQTSKKLKGLILGDENTEF